MQVDVDPAQPLGFGQLREQPVGRVDARLDHPGVVDEHVDRARLGDDTLGLVPAREVGDDAVGADLPRPLVDPLRRRRDRHSNT